VDSYSPVQNSHDEVNRYSLLIVRAADANRAGADQMPAPAHAQLSANSTTSELLYVAGKLNPNWTGLLHERAKSANNISCPLDQLHRKGQIQKPFETLPRRHKSCTPTKGLERPPDRLQKRMANLLEPSEKCILAHSSALGETLPLRRR